MTSRDDVVGLTVELARIDSVNPSLVDGAAGEADVAAFVAQWCQARGLEVHGQDAAPPDGARSVYLQDGVGGGGRVGSLARGVLPELPPACPEPAGRRAQW